jgi:hypothetical protein
MTSPSSTTEAQALAELQSLLAQRLAAADAGDIDERSAVEITESVFAEPAQASVLQSAPASFGEQHADFIAAYNRSVEEEGLPLERWRGF